MADLVAVGLAREAYLRHIDGCERCYDSVARRRAVEECAEGERLRERCVIRP